MTPAPGCAAIAGHECHRANNRCFAGVLLTFALSLQEWMKSTMHRLLLPRASLEPGIKSAGTTAGRGHAETDRD